MAGHFKNAPIGFKQGMRFNTLRGWREVLAIREGTMKQTRFRAWDTKDKQMVTDGTCDHSEGWGGDSCTYLSVGWSGRIFGEINDDGGKNGLHEHAVDIPKDRFILMQFTGLHDAYGVDIYEGDIVKTFNRGTGHIEFGRVLMEGTALAYLGFYIRINEESYTHLDGTLEVIGNIYANPELLETPHA